MTQRIFLLMLLGTLASQPTLAEKMVSSEAIAPVAPSGISALPHHTVLAAGRKIDSTAKPPAMIAQCKNAKAVKNIKVCKSGENDYVEYYEGEKLLGQVKTTLPTKAHPSLYIELYQVHEKARGKGISLILFQRLYEISNPKPLSISGEMAFTNYQTVIDEYRALSSPASPRYNPDLNDVERHKAAAKASPFFRAWKTLGYAKVKEAKFDWVTINGPPYVSQIAVELERD